MALTAKMLKGMGLTDEQRESILDAHVETVNNLKEELDRYKADAQKLDGVQRELDALKAKGNDGYKEKFEKEHKAFEDFKAAQTAKESKAAKEAAVKAYFESKNITGNNLDIVMMASSATIDAVELADGKIKETKALDELVSGKFAGLVSKTGATGAHVSTPANNNGSGIKSREEIYKKDDKGRYILSTAERQKALAEQLASETGE